MKPLSIFDRSYRPPSKFRRLWNWLNGDPGGAFTLFVLVCFALGLWAAVALWRMR